MVGGAGYRVFCVDFCYSECSGSCTFVLQLVWSLSSVHPLGLWLGRTLKDEAPQWIRLGSVASVWKDTLGIGGPKRLLSGQKD
jgi:hypothetical protein